MVKAFPSTKKFHKSNNIRAHYENDKKMFIVHQLDITTMPNNGPSWWLNPLDVGLKNRLAVPHSFFFSFFCNYCYCYYYNVHPLTMTITFDEDAPSMKTWSTMMMITMMGVSIQTIGDSGDNWLLLPMLLIVAVN